MLYEYKARDGKLKEVEFSLYDNKPKSIIEGNKEYFRVWSQDVILIPKHMRAVPK